MDGYRVNVDALLLGAFAARSRVGRSVWDLGAGVGTIGLALAKFGLAEQVHLVENDPMLAGLAEANARRNEVLSATVHPLDVAKLPTRYGGEASLVVCNPPYGMVGRGRPARDTRKSARAGDLGPFVRAARALLGHRGRVCFVYPANSLLHLFETLAKAGLAVKSVRAVHATRETRARILLVEAKAAKPGGTEVLPPLFERECGTYTKEMQNMLEGIWR